MKILLVKLCENMQEDSFSYQPQPYTLTLSQRTQGKRNCVNI